MNNKNKHDYFNMFVELVDFNCQAAINLHATLNQFDPSALKETMNYLHTIEHGADMKKHDLLRLLAAEFIPPIERDDIVALANEIDNVTDAIEDVLMRMYMFNLPAVREDALAFSTLIVKCCEGLKRAMEEFHNFKKSTLLHNYIIEVNQLEEEADNLYCESVHRLFSEKDLPSTEVFGWSETFDHLEKCCDACEHVCTVIEGVIMTNS